MKNNNHSQDQNLVSHRGQKSKLPIGCCLGALGLSVFLVVAVLVGYYFLVPRFIARPLVLINSPHNGNQLETGQSVTVQAVARDDIRVTRVELWVDGQLQQIETSSLEGGTSPFPLLTDWLPTSIGIHTLTVRAFNTQGGRAHASIDVEVVEGIDNDGDRVPNENDACPEQPGRADSDGCPTPGDMDNDGTSDAEDACLEEAGIPGLAGCPDRDGDDISDDLDLCPDNPGLPERGGCPDTGAGDSDGDLVPDDIDLAVDEPGLPEHGGAPVPGEGADDDGDGIPNAEEPPDDPLGDLLPEPDLDADSYIPVEVEALDFEVDEDYEYDSIWCYASLAGGDMERYGPFNPSGNSDVHFGNEWHWDIYAALGGANSVHLMVPDEPLAMEVECGADVTFLGDGGGWGTVYNLGSFRREHERLEWDGTNHYANVEDADGRGFQLKYRICEGACEGMLLQPPVIGSRVNSFGIEILEWNWGGDLESLAGYKLYVNSALIDTIYRNEDYISMSSGSNPLIAMLLLPSCETTYKLTVTAFDDLGRESPPSNTLSVTGEPCPRRVRVTFLSLQTFDLPDDTNENACGEGSGVALGPIDMTFGTPWQSLHLYSKPRGLDSLQGICLEDNSSYSIMELIDECRLLSADLEVDLTCPDVDYIEVPLSSDDDLTILMRITDWDWESGRWIFNNEQTFRADEAGPIEYTFSSGSVYGNQLALTFRIDLVYSEP